MNAQEERERVDFENALGRRLASLCEHAKPYVGRLRKTDSNALLAAAIEAAWERRAAFDPGQHSLPLWWEECLRAASLTRSTWRVWRGNEWVAVSGRALGARE